MKIVDSFPINMAGFKIMQALPHPEMEQVSPFILLHYGKAEISAGKNIKDLGVPPHPHRGFSPVSIIFEGSVHHRDSMGNSSIISEGGIQWLNSGKGMIHSERPTKETAEIGGKQELIQLWVNVPKAHKMDPPEYFAYEQRDLPKLEFGNCTLDLIAGDWLDLKSPVKLFSKLNIFKGQAKSNFEFNLEFDKNFDCSIFILNGEILVNNQLVKGLQFADLRSNKIDLKSEGESRFVILAGENLNEPMASYGPFVMNYQAEIKQTFIDYQKGVFGELNEVF